MAPGLACHITQRGVDRRETFSGEEDRRTYLRLLQQHLLDAGARLLGWCLMTNQLHLVAVPEREDSLSVLLRRVHGRYAQYYNARWGRTGHLWQNRFFACPLGTEHLWAALAYVERNPVRAGLLARAGDYPWSSAAAHLRGENTHGLLDMEWWRREGPRDWERILADEKPDTVTALRTCTYSGRPFGTENFVPQMAERFGRYWTRGRPRKEPARVAAASQPAEQSSLFETHFAEKK